MLWRKKLFRWVALQEKQQFLGILVWNLEKSGSLEKGGFVFLGGFMDDCPSQWKQGGWVLRMGWICSLLSSASYWHSSLCQGEKKLNPPSGTFCREGGLDAGWQCPDRLSLCPVIFPCGPFCQPCWTQETRCSIPTCTPQGPSFFSLPLGCPTQTGELCCASCLLPSTPPPFCLHTPVCNRIPPTNKHAYCTEKKKSLNHFPYLYWGENEAELSRGLLWQLHEIQPQCLVYHKYSWNLL